MGIDNFAILRSLSDILSNNDKSEEIIINDPSDEKRILLRSNCSKHLT